MCYFFPNWTQNKISHIFHNMYENGMNKSVSYMYGSILWKEYFIFIFELFLGAARTARRAKQITFHLITPQQLSQIAQKLVRWEASNGAHLHLKDHKKLLNFGFTMACPKLEKSPNRLLGPIGINCSGEKCGKDILI
jgi:hypothetical protein